MRKRFLLLTGWLATLFLLVVSTAVAQPSDSKSVVHAVLFYSPTCPHCHEVIQNLLAPMVKQYGDQLQIVAVDTTKDDGSAFYQSAVNYYQIPADRRGVPTLIVGDTVLVGSTEIPEKFPDMVETALNADGIDWPSMPGMPDVVAASAPPQAVTPAPVGQSPVSTPTPEIATEQSSLPAPASGPAETSSLQEALKPAEDPAGVALGWIVLVGLAAALGVAGWRAGLAGRNLLRLQPAPAWQLWLFPALVVVGLGIAGYLAYVEINQVEAICGPVGHCNAVQTSAYARILDIPVAVLGLLNYLVLLGLWLGRRFIPGNWAAPVLLALTLAGVCFSIYLTALELFVIHAVCMWCLGSAVVTALLLALVWMGASYAPAPEENAVTG